MGKKKNKKNKAVEAEVIPFENDQNKEETEVKKKISFETVGKIVVGVGVGILGVGATVFGVLRGKNRSNDEETSLDQEAVEELPADLEEVPEEEE